MKRHIPILTVAGLALALLAALNLQVAGTPARAAAPTQTLTLVGQMDEGDPALQAVLEEFTSRTGIVTLYEMAGDPSRLRDCTVNENCPDLAIVPWPGLLAELGAAGTLVDLGSFVNHGVLNANYTPTWIDLGTVDSTLYGVWFNANNKSLVWYDPAEFSIHEWLTPTNWAELLSLSDQIVSGELTPWSVGADSGAASGWPLTDWFEDILLHSQGPAIYDALADHTIAWTSTEIVSATEHFGQIFGNEAYQLGGKEGTINTSFIDAIYSPFQDPPDAYLHRQGSFAQNFIEGQFAGQVPGMDYATFPFPDIDPAYGDAVMGSGDVAMVFHDSPDAQALINYLITTDAAEIWVAQGQTSPNRSVDFGLYPDSLRRAAAETLANASIFRFDLSDQLPSDLNLYVWLAIQDLVRVAPDPDAMYDVLADIEAVASGTQPLEVAGQWGGDTAACFRDVLRGFSDRSGVPVSYIQVPEASIFLRSCSQNGNCPDVGLSPWPGLISELGPAGVLVDLGAFISHTVLNANYTPTWIDLGTVDSSLYGVWFNANNKSLVWYDPVEFSGQGWLTPTNWTELLALSDLIVSGGMTPWSVGAESGAASGWPLTDWFEDILLRSQGPDAYDALIARTIPWTGTEILSATEHFGQVFGNEAYQLGGKEGTINTFFGEAIYPPFRDPAEAYLHRQASFAQNFIEGQFPTQVPGVDYATFPFPDIDPAYTDAVMGAGDMALMFHDSPDTRALVNYLITTEAAEAWIDCGGVSPNRSVDFGRYPDALHRAAAETMANASIFRFDLSDQLPSELNQYVWLAMQDLVMAAPDPAAMESVLAGIEAKASQYQLLVPAGMAATIHYTGTQGAETIIDIPTGAVTETTMIQHLPLDQIEDAQGFRFAGRAFSLQAFRDGMSLPGLSFPVAVTLTLSYSDDDVSGLMTDTLSVQYWDGTEWSSDGITLVERDGANQRIVVTISHLTDFALFGQPARIYLPLVLRDAG